MTIEIELGGHLKHTVPVAAENIQTLRTRHSLTVAQALHCLKIDSHESTLLTTVDGVGIPPNERRRHTIRDGQVLKITPWYGHLRLCDTDQFMAK